MVTINALVAADSVLIPVEAEYLPAKGLEQLMRTIYKTQKKLNRKLKIEGVLMTMVDERTNLCKGIIDFINEVYENRIRIFQSRIPRSVRAAEIAAVGKSLYTYDPDGRAAKAYSSLVEEVLANE
jgi:chromosome partitioning protein